MSLQAVGELKLLKFDLTHNKSLQNPFNPMNWKRRAMWAPLNATCSLSHTAQSHSVNQKTINVHLRFKLPLFPLHKHIHKPNSQTFVLTNVLLMSLSGQTPVCSVSPFAAFAFFWQWAPFRQTQLWLCMQRFISLLKTQIYKTSSPTRPAPNPVRNHRASWELLSGWECLCT